MMHTLCGTHDIMLFCKFKFAIVIENTSDMLQHNIYDPVSLTDTTRNHVESLWNTWHGFLHSLEI